MSNTIYSPALFRAMRALAAKGLSHKSPRGECDAQLNTFNRLSISRLIDAIVRVCEDHLQSCIALQFFCLLQVSSDSPKLNEEVTVTISIHNFYPIDLTNGKFHFESRFKPKNLITDCNGTVRASKTKEETATFQAESPGYHNSTVTFNSKEIAGVSGSFSFFVLQ